MVYKCPLMGMGMFIYIGTKATPFILVLFLLCGCADLREAKKADDVVPAEVEGAVKTETTEQANWLRQNARSPEDYLVGLYDSHQVVIFGEAHNVREHKAFINGLLERLYTEADVRCLAWEFSCTDDNDRLERLVTAEEFDEAAALAFARDQFLDWNSADHLDLIQAVWRVNQARPTGTQPMRMVGLTSRQMFEACHEFHSVKPESSRYWEVLEMILRGRDEEMARDVERQIIEPGVKGLVFVGRCHDMTKCTYPNGVPEWFLKQLGAVDVPKGMFPPDKPFRAIMGNLLYRRHGDCVFQVWPYTEMFAGIEEAMAQAGLRKAGFTVEGSPFEEIKSSSAFADAPGVAMKLLAQGLVYLGPMRELHPNQVIPGFVTEDMFQKHRDYYERDYGRSFNNAKEVDEHLQKHRWPWHRR